MTLEIGWEYHNKYQEEPGRAMSKEPNYTQQASSAVFHSRYEACLHGAPSIKPEHLLLGLLRADPELFRLLSPGATEINEFRAAFESYVPSRPVVDSKSLTPLSRAARRVLKIAVRESESLGDNLVSTEHILVGLIDLSESGISRFIKKSRPRIAEILSSCGFDLEQVKLGIRSGKFNSQTRAKHHTAVLGVRPYPTVLRNT